MKKTPVPGITLRSFAACIFGMLMCAIYAQVIEIIVADYMATMELVLPIPVMGILIFLSLLVGTIYLISKSRFLTRQELFCVYFAMLIACPIMTQGMWHRFVGLLGASPRTASFDYIDAYSDKLWPHGKNLLKGAFSEADSKDLAFKCEKAKWQKVEYEEHVEAELPVLSNSASDQDSSITVTVPLEKDGKRILHPGNPYLISFLAKGKDFGTKTYIFCRIYGDKSSNFNEIINVSKAEKVTFIHKKGFIRHGVYAVYFPKATEKYVKIEFGLHGLGSATFADPKCFSVAALEGAYRGKKILNESDYAKLPLNEKGGVIAKPDKMWSWAGIKFILKGYIPIEEWYQTIFSWLTLILLLTSATFAIVVIMRKQWAENERYMFPNFRIPFAIMGEEEDEESKPFVSIWRNRFMWAGFALAIFWSLMKCWNFYNPAVPNMSIDVSLRPYFQDPGWGQMWYITFSISLFLVSICIFFELNVLVSIVIGFFFFRSLYWIGEFSDLKVYPGYPFRYQQAIGAYLGYAAVVVFFTRKYLLNVARKVVSGQGKDHGEIMSYRVAFTILVLSFAGAALWAKWQGASCFSILLFFFFLVLVGFVSAKLRTECGLIYAYFTPYNAMLFVSLLGGMTAFGATGMFCCLLASGFLTVSCFFLIPGAQLEAIEYGRRLNIRRRHIIYVCALGILGGVIFGGWTFLSNSYSVGGDNIKYQWAYHQEWFFRGYRSQHIRVSNEYVRSLKGTTRKQELKPETWAYLISAFITIVIAILRQFFPWFWFHPIGFILGSSHMSEGVWGSALLAFIIRYIVLKLGGATTVKNKLQPFFVGALVGCVVAVLLMNGLSIVKVIEGTTSIYGKLP